MTTLSALRAELASARDQLAGRIERARGDTARLRSAAAPGIVPRLNLVFAPPLTWAAMPLALAGLGGSFGYARKQDLTGYTQVRFRAIKLGTAGVAGAKIYLRYRTAFSTTAADWLQLGETSQVSLAIDSTNGLLDSGWIPLASAAKADVFLAVLGEGGDGAVSPVFGLIWAEFNGDLVSTQVQVIAAAVASEVVNSGTATATYRLKNNGDVEKVEGAVTTVIGTWITNPADVALYECRATLSGSALDGGSSATGSWFGLGTTREWTISQASAGAKNATLDIEVRLVGGEITPTGRVTLSAAFTASDITPDAISFADISISDDDGVALTDTVTISGITEPVILQLALSSAMSADRVIDVNRSGSFIGSYGSGSVILIEVSNGDTLYFIFTNGQDGSTWGGTATLTNSTDGGAAVDSFTYSLTNLVTPP